MSLIETEIKRREFQNSEKICYSFKREIIALVWSKTIQGAVKYTNVFRTKKSKIIECECEFLSKPVGVQLID